MVYIYRERERGIYIHLCVCVCVEREGEYLNSDQWREYFHYTVMKDNLALGGRHIMQHTDHVTTEIYI